MESSGAAESAGLHPAALEAARLLADCAVRRGRRRGPGGQHRNKVETAIVLTHLPSGVRSEATERRSQQENHQVAVFRLRVNLALQVRCRPVEPATPSPTWRARCAGGRLAINPHHDEFPELLAEALDVLTARDMDLQASAETLQINASQLTKLLRLEPRALALVNARRRAAGRRVLK